MRESTLELRVSAQQSHETSWRRFRAVRVIFFLLVAAWIPYGRVTYWVWSQRHWPEKVGIGLILVYVLVLMALGCCYALWPCPRCGKVFRGHRPYTGKSCYYCKLPKWT
jgi:hypothetical protein